MNMAVGSQSEDGQIELELQRKGKTAPRVTPQEIEALTDGMTFKTHHFEGTTSTIAIAVLANGFVAGIGSSAAISLANFDAEIGAKIAIKDAVRKAIDKLWELEGYALRKRLDELKAQVQPPGGDLI
jgi:hypothetical protein